MIVLIPYINLLNLSWIIKCLFFEENSAFKRSKYFQGRMITLGGVATSIKAGFLMAKLKYFVLLHNSHLSGIVSLDGVFWCCRYFWCITFIHGGVVWLWLNLWNFIFEEIWYKICLKIYQKFKQHVSCMSKLDLSQRMTKPTKWHVHLAMTQISLGICPVWSVFTVRSMGS